MNHDLSAMFFSRPRLPRLYSGVALLCLTCPAYALEIDPHVMPEINLAGHVNATVSYAKPYPGSDTSTLDAADSSFLMGFSKYLYDSKRYAFGVFGVKMAEEESAEGAPRVHQFHAGWGGTDYEVTLGQARLESALLTLPTLRDSDMSEFLSLGNGHANRLEDDDALYGGVLRGVWWFQPQWALTASAVARVETDIAGTPQRRAHLNGYAASLLYRMPEAALAGRGWRMAGIRVDQQRWEALGALPRASATAWTGAFSYALSDNPEHRWDVGLQVRHNRGSTVPALDEPVALARAQSTAGVAALAYQSWPALQKRWQAALSVGWKRYSDFAQATSYSVVPSYVYYLGSGVEVMAQYRYIAHRPAVASLYGTQREQQVWLGVRFAFDATFNESVAERGSLLQLEHNISGVGPAGMED